MKKDLLGKKVWVYYNLHKQTFSIKYKNKVRDYGNFIILENVEFVVQPGGRKRVIKDKVKNVHAFVCGELIYYNKFNQRNDDFVVKDKRRIITYNPYLYDSFVIKPNKKPIYKANKILMLNTNKDKLFIV